jgi:Tol biopolymer transport system component
MKALALVGITLVLLAAACGSSGSKTQSGRTATPAPTPRSAAPTEANAEQESQPPHVLAALPEGKLLVEAPAATAGSYRETFVIDGSRSLWLAPTQVTISADKRFIFYVDWSTDVDPRPTALVVRRTNGQDVFRLQLSTPFYGPYWSPGGNRYVFQIAQTIYVRSADSGEQLQFHSPEGTHLVSWFADGSSLLLVKEPVLGSNADRNIYIMDATIGTASELVMPPDATIGPAAEFDSFSPDGRYVSYPVGNFQSGWDLWIMEIATRRTCLLIKHAPSHQYPQGPRWSADSRSVTYYAANDPARGFTDPHLVEAETCADTTIEPTPPHPTATEIQIPGLPLRGYKHYLWSPGGRYVVVYTFQPRVSPLGPRETPAEGKPIPTPSPGSAQVYVVDTQTGSVTTLVDEQREFTPTAWLP